MLKPTSRIFRYSQVFLRYNLDALDHDGNIAVSIKGGAEVNIVSWDAPNYGIMENVELHIVTTGRGLKREYIEAYCDRTITHIGELLNPFHPAGRLIKVFSDSLLALGERQDDQYRPGLGSVNHMRG